MELPYFKYHPDPIKTGSLTASSNKCVCCGECRGYIYTGLPYCEEELEDCICPWCIADGSAHKKYDLEFVDFDGIGGYGDWDQISQDIKEKVAYKTPGFTGWQQERWWTHCNDAAAFLGHAGKNEIQEYGKELEMELQKEVQMTDEQWTYYFNDLDKDGSPCAYIFKCLHCGKLGGYSDCH